LFQKLTASSKSHNAELIIAEEDSDRKIVNRILSDFESTIVLVETTKRRGVGRGGGDETRRDELRDEMRRDEMR
jgi:hypothetical protein